VRRGERRHEKRRRSLSILLVLFVVGAAAFLIADLSRRSMQPSAKRPIVARRLEAAPEEGVRVIKVGPARLTLDTGARISVPIGEVSGRWLVELKRGRVRAEVETLKSGEYFAVKTFNVTAGVRGTTFIVSLIGGYRTEVEVIEGKVSVEGSGGVPFFVSAGQVVSASGLEEPEMIRDTGGRTIRDRWLDELPNISAPSPAPSFLEAAPSTAGAAPAAAPPSDSLNGAGTWTGSKGFSGSVRIRIEPAAGRFSGQFTGSGAGGASITGVFHGDHVGDGNEGRMSGEVTFQTSVPSPAPAAPDVKGRVEGTLKNGVVTGRMTSPAVDGTFEIRL
jgi:hypothetical protein